ncbi:MAG: SbcC/MukB-like Walker B domain-containing protein, partial [Gemmatimonadales bacterium]
TLEADLRVADHQVQAAEERIERLRREGEEAGSAAARLDDVRKQLEPLEGLREEVRVLDRQAEAFARRKGTIAQLEEVRRHFASVEERTAGLPKAPVLGSARDRVGDLRASLTALALDVENARTAWVRDAQDARTKRQGLLDQYQELKDQRQRLVKAGPEGNCPTCTRPLGAGYEKVLGLLDRQMEEVVSNGNFYKQRIEQLQEEPPDVVELERRRTVMEAELSAATGELGRLEAQAQEGRRLTDERRQLEARVGELESALAGKDGAYDEARHGDITARIKALEPVALEAERLKVLADRAAPLAGELSVVTRDRAGVAERAQVLRAKHRDLGYSEQAYTEAREAVEVAERERRESEVALVRARGERAAAGEAVDAVARRRAERAEREREAATTANDLALHQELDRALTDLRTELNATLRPDLSELASGFLRDLTNGRYTDLELDEDYGTTLLDDGDPKAVISGGEEDVANLALRLAISQMIAERAGQPLSLLILDEIFGSLDEDRRTAVLDLLRSLADRFPQVILITHVESVREGFDRVVRVGVDLARGVATVRDEALGGHDVAA